MTKADIYTILDKNIQAHRTNMKILIGLGIAMLIAAVFIYLYMPDPGFILYLFGGMGIIFPAGGAYSLISNNMEKQTAQLKSILDHQPTHLVWAYTLRRTNRGATSSYVIMNFKDGSKFEIEEAAIPDKDCGALVNALSVINPDMHLGYSEDLEKKFKAKQL